MTWKDNLAGWVAVTIFPAWLKAKNKDGKYPNRITFAPDIHEKMIDLMKSRQYNINEKTHESTTFMSMEILCDEKLGSGEWNMGWAA